MADHHEDEDEDDDDESKGFCHRIHYRLSAYLGPRSARADPSLRRGNFSLCFSYLSPPFFPLFFFLIFLRFVFFFPRFLFIKILIADWKISFRDERGWRKRFALENNIEWDRNVFHLSDEVDWFELIRLNYVLEIWMRNFTSIEQLGRTLIFKKTSPRYYIYYIVEFIITVSTMLERKNRIGHIIAWSVAISIGADWTASSNEILRIFLISSDYKSIELLLPISNDS